MTVREALAEGAAFLARASNPAASDTPWLDASLLLAETLSCTKERLVIAYPETIENGDLGRYRELLRRRGEGIPVSYLRRRKEFYGLEFYVDERVLVPRPDTETLVEAAREALGGRPEARVLDLCTGSGCVAIALKSLQPRLAVTGADVSAAAGEVFARNALNLLGRPLPFIRSDLFAAVPGVFDLIVSNPPYLASGETRAMREGGWPEPELALDGGPDGTDFLFSIIAGAPAHLVRGGILMLELDPEQAKKCANKMKECGYINIDTRRDLGGRERVLRGDRP